MKSRHSLLRRRDPADLQRFSRFPHTVNNLALHALNTVFATDYAIVDEKAICIAIAETATD